MKKQVVLDLLRGMPDDIDFEELQYRLFVLRKLEIAEAALEAGDFASDEEVQAVLTGKRSRHSLGDRSAQGYTGGEA